MWLQYFVNVEKYGIYKISSYVEFFSNSNKQGIKLKYGKLQLIRVVEFEY
jgi:hypothetical protein